MDRINSVIAEAYQNGSLVEKETLQKTLLHYMVHAVGRAPEEATTRDWYYALAFLIRGVLSERHINTKRSIAKNDTRRVYYLSMEYLIGRSMANHLSNLGLSKVVDEVLGEFDQSLTDVEACEVDAALGNGGLGRLAACFLDSLATHAYPGFGYGLRYDYGMFHQHIQDGRQQELPEHWLRLGNPWEFERANVVYRVRFGGRVLRYKNEAGDTVRQWVDTHDVLALAFNIPVSGFGAKTAGNLRLWSARATSELDLSTFNEGDYMGAVRGRVSSENLTKVLYPADNSREGQELRLKQEYFFVSATMQDVLARHLRLDDNLENLPEKVCVQLNDTHPALAIPELVRLLVDAHGFEFEAAWELTRQVFAYTNHTLLPEALEVWGVDLLEALLPRHLEIIYKINDLFLRQVRHTFPGDGFIMRRLSLVDDDRRAIRMAHLAIAGSTKVNGVAELHTKLLREELFRDFEALYPGKFLNMTNGITPRRWLLGANPALAGLIESRIGLDWATDLSRLKALIPLADDPEFRAAFAQAKRANKERLARFVWNHAGVELDPAALIDSQVKRIHEYKRQLLNVLHVVTRYNRLRADPGANVAPRGVIFAGKAAPSYYMAKLIIRLINDIAEIVNNDPVTGGRLKVVFVPNYNVTAAEVIMPGSDLSEQISTAGMEASGTGNMKFGLNGALTIGTLDGANIEILEEVGADNIFIFGLTTEQVRRRRAEGYDPWHHYHEDSELRQALDMINNGFFSPEEPERYRPVFDSLLRGGDTYMLMADYRAYVDMQDRVDAVYADPDRWTRMAILNVANMGKFSSDRTIHEYAREIWGVQPIR